MQLPYVNQCSYHMLINVPSVYSRSTSTDDEEEPEFIDLAELGSKVTDDLLEGADDNGSEDSNDGRNGPDVPGGDEDGEYEMEDGEEVWICRFCDRAFDSEQQLTCHEKQHN